MLKIQLVLIGPNFPAPPRTQAISSSKPLDENEVLWLSSSRPVLGMGTSWRTVKDDGKYEIQKYIGFNEFREYSHRLIKKKVIARMLFGQKVVKNRIIAYSKGNGWKTAWSERKS